MANSSLANAPENDRSNLGVILDPNIRVKPGIRLQTFLEDNGESLGLDFTQGLTITDIKQLLKTLRNTGSIDGQKVYLHELLADAELVLPTLVIPERDPELEKRIQHLRNTLAEKEYQKMVKNVNVGNRFKVEDSIGYQMKQINTGLLGVFQFIISIAAAFLFGFIGVEVFGGYTLDLAVKLLLGIIFALVVGLAELYFLAINLSISEAPPNMSSNSVRSISSKKEGHLKMQ